MKPPPEARWRAGKDRIGHAFVDRQQALCGLASWEERYDWPILTRHPACTERLNELTVEALRGPVQTRAAW